MAKHADEALLAAGRLPWPGRGLLWLVEHWLGLAGGFLLLFASLPVVEPVLMAAGWTGPAAAIFAAYSLVCHQMPSRSYFLLGHQMAYCQRNTAIYGAVALASITWARFRPRVSWWLFALLCLPMAVDGFTQLAAMRESTWELRTITGLLFGLGCVWFAYPFAGRLAGQIRADLLQAACA